MCVQSEFAVWFLTLVWSSSNFASDSGLIDRGSQLKSPGLELNFAIEAVNTSIAAIANTICARAAV